MEEEGKGDHTGGKAYWQIPGLWASSSPSLAVEELWWGHNLLKVYKAENGRQWEAVEGSTSVIYFPACMPASLLGPLPHPITQTQSNNRPQNNPNITYGTGTPKAPAINILLINNCTAQWKLCCPTIKAPWGLTVSQTNIHWETLDTSGAQTQS